MYSFEMYLEKEIVETLRVLSFTPRESQVYNDDESKVWTLSILIESHPPLVAGT